MNILSKRVTVGRARIEVPRDMAWCFEQDTFYERNVTHWLEQVLNARPDHVFYDVGANIGFYTVLAAQRARKVYAFEPVQKTFRILSRNVRCNRLANVDVFQIGLSDEEGERDIHLYSSSGNNSIYERGLPPGHALRWLGNERIRLARADDLVTAQSLLAPTVIKVDVEGAELPMLRGAVKLIASARPILFMELSENTFRDAGYSSADLLAELHRQGYLLLGLAEDVADLGLYRVGGNIKFANIIAFPDRADIPRYHGDGGTHD